MTSELRRRSIFGFRFIDVADVGSVVDALLARQGADTAIPDAVPLVCTPNVDLLVHLERNDSPSATAVARRATYVLADGQPVVWASRLLGEPLPARLAGSTLLAELWPRIVAEERPVLVIAANERVATFIRADHPGAVVMVAPMLSRENHAMVAEFAADCTRACDATLPEFVFEAVGYPTQYLLVGALALRWADELEPPVHFAIGASFDMYYGLRRRSPQWVQDLGMEWFFRFVQEPRRLFRRYFIDDVAFVGVIWREYRRTGRTRSPAHPSMRPPRPIGRVLPGPWGNRRRHAEDDELAKTAN